MGEGGSWVVVFSVSDEDACVYEYGGAAFTGCVGYVELGTVSVDPVTGGLGDDVYFSVDGADTVSGLHIAADLVTVI